MRLLLLSEDPVLVDALEAELARRLPALRVIGKCYSLREGMKAVGLLLPDAIVIDEAIKGMNEITMSVLKAHSPAIFVLARGDGVSPYSPTDGVFFVGEEKGLIVFLESFK